ncbi:uncharacterized protein LOC126404539 [Epinephelus moara]|uniref:uncharacterized protein LOC126404539 n=1 Tax=Epinephelus moara TaxID=300413 RepID=UPI00214F5062|nr:uncharacterized protein LOC126404539 [Epinephelus moara]
MRLATFAKLVLVLPHSNADAERETKTRNSLALDGTLSSIMTIKMAGLESCFTWEPSPEIIKASKKATDKMNIILLIAVMLTLSVVDGNNQPCLWNPNNNAYNQFVRRHIIQEPFNRLSWVDWQNYIRRHRLRNRPRQSFIEGRDVGRVRYICNGGGYPILPPQPGNLCMSSSTLLVYDLTVNNNGRVTSLMQKQKKVIVACDKVVNRCRPVHFERYRGQRPDKRAGPCMP